MSFRPPFQIQACSQIIILNSPPKATLWPSYLRSSEPGLTNLGHHQTPIKQLASALDHCTQPKAFLFGEPVCACQHSNKLIAPRSPRYFDKSGAALLFLQPRKVQRQEGIWPVMKCLKGIIGFPSSQPSHRPHNPHSI